MPATWELYGVDGNQDGLKDPYNPVDAIFAAARYLKAAGAETDLRAAIFAYNHADWYVDSVILRARYIGGLPADLVGSLSGLTQGRFPVQAKASYAKDVRRTAAKDGANPAYVVESSDRRNGIKIFAKRRRAGRRRQRRPHRQDRPQPPARQLRDAAGRLRQHVHVRAPQVGRGVLPDAQAARRRRQGRAARAQAAAARRRPRAPASATTKAESAGAQGTAKNARPASDAGQGAPRRRAATAPAKERLFANPEPPERRGRRRRAAGVRAAPRTSAAYLNRVFGLDRSDVDMKPLKRGARVTSGTVLGRIGKVSEADRAAPAVRDPARPAAAPRGSTRSRSSTAGSCSSRPRSTAPRTATRSSARTRRRRRSARSC